MATMLREAPDLPELPAPEPRAIPSPAVMRSGAALPVPAHGGGNGGAGGVSLGRQLRRILSLITGGGLMLAMALLALQAIAKPGLRPTDLLAQFEAAYELGVINAKNGGDPGHPAMTEIEYSQKIAEAQREGAAAAEARLQEKIIALQTDQQRIVGAYSALYQRANLIAQAGVEMEAQLQQVSAQATAQSEGGNNVVATYADIGCALGYQGGCDAADKARERIRTDIQNARTGNVGTRIKELMGQVPDPASLVAGSDMSANGVPAVSQPAAPESDPGIMPH